MRLGADPEVFLMRKTAFLSSIGRVGGTKEKPLQIPGLATGYTVQEDNVTVEFGIPPCDTRDKFSAAIARVQKVGLEFIQSKNEPLLKFSKLSCTIMPKKEMGHPNAFIFGCEPDYNAWTGEVNGKPDPDHKYKRSCGGHIHVETALNPMEVVKAMDVTIGLYSLFVDLNGGARRTQYGKAGACRPKPYGVEYRVPSNFWIFSPERTGMIWDRTARALALIEQGVDFSYLGDSIQHAINNDDKPTAQRILNSFNLGTTSSTLWMEE